MLRIGRNREDLSSGLGLEGVEGLEALGEAIKMNCFYRLEYSIPMADDEQYDDDQYVEEEEVVVDLQCRHSS